MAQATQKPASKPDPKDQKATKPGQAYTPDKAAQSSAPAQSDQAPPIGEMISRSLSAFNQDLQGATGANVVSNAPPVFRSEDMQSMQRLLGNRASNQVIQRWNFPWEDDEEEESEAEETDEERAQREMQEFREAGPYPAGAAGETVRPRTGIAGGFNARYDPDSMTLTIMVNIGFNFVDGMTIAGNTVTAAEASMRGEATRINGVLAGLGAAQRTAAMNTIRDQWQWTGAADPRIATWMNDYKTNVQTAWGSAGSGIVFQSSKDGWEEQLARVVVDIDAQNVTSAAAAAVPGRQPTHCQSTIYKTPDRDVFGAYVEPGTASETDQELYMGSGQITAQSQILNQQVSFAPGSSALDAWGEDMLEQFIISFQAPPGETGTTITIVGRSSSTGETTERGRARNQQLSDERAAAVANFLRTRVVEGRRMENINWRIHGVVGAGSAGATEAEEWCRADITIAGGQGQNIAAHEFGHMIGLDDEYAATPLRDAAGNIVTDADGNAVSRGLVSGTGGDVGDNAEHNALGVEMGVGGAVYENNANMMSLGSTILPQHYATFMQALHDVSSSSEWQVRS
ncbi:MAG: OmpA family protein [Anaerolineaceae bacterium]|nr:OmpA family protein [Anaerolineaceae bacterium]